jgi:hypothetical protein
MISQPILIVARYCESSLGGYEAATLVIGQVDRALRSETAAQVALYHEWVIWWGYLVADPPKRVRHAERYAYLCEAPRTNRSHPP